MAFLNQPNYENDVYNLVNNLEKSQWTYLPNFSQIKDLPIIGRNDLRNLDLRNEFGHSKTSGSTGEPVIVGKTYRDLIWYGATSVREFRWLKWDVTKTIAIIKPGGKKEVLKGWGIPESIERFQGLRFTNDLLPISQLQTWLEEVNPHYIHCFPSVFKQLDTSKISNFIAWKGTGELGGLCYSSEECGIIALRCPDNPKVYHVMENQLVERDNDGALIITTLSNKFIKRYKHGDHIELGECHCGRKLQTITEIKGRVRNMMILPNGDKKWPQIGSLEFESFGIERFKMIQHKVDRFELQIISEPLLEKEIELIQLIKQRIGFECDIKLNYIYDFDDYKFEEFVSKLIK